MHRLPAADQPGCRIWLKREDEAGGTIAAGKYRKMGSLLPWLVQNGFEKAIVLGSAQSNQVLAAAQLLPQAGIQPLFFLKQGNHQGPGNAFLTQLLTAQSDIRYFSPGQWPTALESAKQQAEEQPEKTYVIPEGAFCPPALPGTFSLAHDLLRNFANHDQLTPTHLFMDAGTGLSAIGLLMELARHSTVVPPMVHIVGMALDEQDFASRIATAECWEQSPPKTVSYRFWQPSNAKSFGAVNATVLNCIQRYAQDWGVLTDPIYSAKLFYEAEHIVKAEQLKGDIVWIHSGGVNSLMGFFPWFQKAKP